MQSRAGWSRFLSIRRRPHQRRPRRSQRSSAARESRQVINMRSLVLAVCPSNTLTGANLQACTSHISVLWLKVGPCHLMSPRQGCLSPLGRMMERPPRVVGVLPSFTSVLPLIPLASTDYGMVHLFIPLLLIALSLLLPPLQASKQLLPPLHEVSPNSFSWFEARCRVQSPA